MDKKQFFIGMVVASLMGAFIAMGTMYYFGPEPKVHVIQADNQPVMLSNGYSFDTTKAVVPAGLNFISAAKNATPGVVHIRTTFKESATSAQQQQMEEYFKEFFGEQGPRGQSAPAQGSGSGVIVSADGYIVNNNHVVENAQDIEVLLNDNSTYKAEIVGLDPTTDLAVLKVSATGLLTVPFGNSDEIEIGEWVLAVGNPFDFRSTVTAGIVSAKGRNINILRDRNNLQIESFIQTDAAVNPGNSGGALVNLKGQLVGINTAIATPTGSFAGYSFAVPSNLVNKVVKDIIEFGVVQRALLGINIRDVNAQLAKEENLDVLEGVYVINVNASSGANEAGIKSGDVIVAVDGQKVTKTAELQEKIAMHRPGDRVNITVRRDKEEKRFSVLLKNTLNSTTVVANSNDMSIEGATFENVSDETKKKLKIEGGAKIVSIENGKWQNAGIKEGFIITGIDKRPILTVEDLSSAISRTSAGSGLLIEGIYPGGEKAYYGIGW